MENLIESIENKVIRNCGFENRKTLLVFRFTSILRKMAGLN